MTKVEAFIGLALVALAVAGIIYMLALLGSVHYAKTVTDIVVAGV